MVTAWLKDSLIKEAQKQDLTTFKRDKWQPYHLEDSEPLNIDLRIKVAHLPRNRDCAQTACQKQGCCVIQKCVENEAQKTICGLFFRKLCNSYVFDLKILYLNRDDGT